MSDKYKENFSLWLDFFRWVAAVQVVFFHINHRFFFKLFEVNANDRSLLHYLFSAISSFGTPAVMVFFVLSGYLVGGSTATKYIYNQKFNFISYMANRLARLWTVLIPSIFLAFIVNGISVHYFNAINNGIFSASGLDESLGVATCNVLFLQTALCGQFGWNGALWSLFHEFWYYVSFPLLMVAIWGKGNIYLRTASAITFIMLLLLLSKLQFVGPNIFAYFGVWFIGVIVAIRAKPFFKLNNFYSISIFLLSLIVWRLISPKGEALTEDWCSIKTLIDYLPAFAFANLLLALKNDTEVDAPPFGLLNKKLAGFSFSLYCIHTPLVNCFGAFMVFAFGIAYPMKHVNLLAISYALICVCFCIVIAFLFSEVTEKHTYKVRKWMYRIFRIS